jgi:hypothetical protein
MWAASFLEACDADRGPRPGIGGTVVAARCWRHGGGGTVVAAQVVD